MESRNYFQCDIPNKAPMEIRHFQTRFESVFEVKKDSDGKLSKQLAFGEILSRIRYDAGNELSPNQFLSMLDSPEKRIDFDYKLILHLLQDERGSRQLTTWIHNHPNRKFSINITLDTLLSNDFITKITSLITKYGPNFIIELLEDFDFSSNFSSKDDIEHFQAVLYTLCRLKIPLALDDYPAKSNTAEFLSLIPKKTLQIVKIDGDFIVKKMRESLFISGVFQAKMRAVRADILEKQPNVRIVCEKIEDKKMLQNLIDAGFTYFQGFYLESPSRPTDGVIQSVRDRTNSCLK